MPLTFIESQSHVARLVKQFRTNLNHYRAPNYKEAQARQDLIDPLFEALGWDVHNQQGVAPAYKEVLVEESLDIEGHQKAADYTFRVGREPIFYVEAKRPGISIKTAPEHAYQLRRYAWNSNLALSILTDFEELAIYEGRVRPNLSDKVSVARVNFYTYEDYPDRWREMWDVFSREAVLSGSFQQYAEAAKGKRGTSEVDAEFLKDISGWREVLARNLALRNAELTPDELNDAVQRTLDRLIFLRIAEDRSIEPYEQLRQAGEVLRSESITHRDGETSPVYSRLIDLFRAADRKYNSGLFDFSKGGDRWMLDLSIDDKVLKAIIDNLYYPNSPYRFNDIPVEILGNVYEQFLGKVIRLTAGHQAKVEEKPEVKKAGGVYYTPAYIVEYIVKQTVGQQIAGKSPKQLDGFRVLDMACGSGSFLLGAYQYLLDYYLQWHIAHQPERHPQIVRQIKGDWRLTVAEKKRILIAHIYGVDIDRQAVEVSKLSLLLKVLEGENDESLQLRLFDDGERALPNLDDNIKCGNSLIGPDYFDNQLMPDEAEMRRVNPFDWAREFPQVLARETAPTPALPRRTAARSSSTGEGAATPPSVRYASHRTGGGWEGGFDCIIGNPPYIRIQVMKEWAPLEVEAYKRMYTAASAGNYDIYVVFAEKGLSLLNKHGRLGFILPHKFFNAQYGAALRDLIAQGQHLSHVVHFGDQQVFAGATTYTCLMFLDKAKTEACHFVKAADLAAWRVSGEAIDGHIPADQITTAEWNFAVGEGTALFDTLSKMPVKLGNVADLFVGLQTDADDVYIVEEIERDKKRVLCESKATGQRHWFEDDHLKSFLKGSLNIRRYRLSDATKRLIFPYETRNGKSVLLTPQEYKQRFPLTWKYLEENHERLSARNKGQMGQDWYGYVYKKNHTRFDQPKILVPSIATGSAFAIDIAGKFYFVGSGGGGGGGYGVLLHSDVNLNNLYLLGLLNSRVLDFFLKKISTPFRGGFLALNRQYIEQLPIRSIDFTNAADKAAHDRMVKLVDTMLHLHPRLAAAKSAHDQALLQRQIDATDQQIDALVYQLYGLTDDEIKIVEGHA